MSSCVGKIYTSILPYYDKAKKSTLYKSRPVLILAEPIGIDTEYNVLPVATIKNPGFYNHLYDVELVPNQCPLLTLYQVSYVRTHKQTVIYRALIDFKKCIGDLKGDYPGIYYDALERLNKFNKTIQEFESN